jgi:hypothetical protein
MGNKRVARKVNKVVSDSFNVELEGTLLVAAPEKTHNTVKL